MFLCCLIKFDDILGESVLIQFERHGRPLRIPHHSQVVAVFSLGEDHHVGDAELASDRDEVLD